MRHLLTIQYLGTRYAGWQTQANAVGVQQVIEGAARKMMGQTVRLEGASRTDSGVHAAGQRAHADIPIEISPSGLVLGLNDLLPSDIRIVAAEPVAETFHCRYAAVSKRYVYRIWNDAVASVFLAATHAHIRQELDAERMAGAVVPLAGEHDFKSFTVASPEATSTVRTVHEVSVEREGKVVSIAISADGFLRFMIRRIAGSLIEIGRGALPPEAITDALEPSFAEARWTAPPVGLTLEEIRYAAGTRRIKAEG